MGPSKSLCNIVRGLIYANVACNLGLTLAPFATADQTIVVAAAIADLAAFLISVVAFFIWLYRSVAALPKFGIDGFRFTPGWSVGYWFIPFLNVIRCTEILRALGQATDRLQAKDKQGKAAPMAVGWFWCQAASGLFGRLTSVASDPSAILLSAALGGLLWLVAGTLLAEYVRIVGQAFAAGRPVQLRAEGPILTADPANSLRSKAEIQAAQPAANHPNAQNLASYSAMSALALAGAYGDGQTGDAVEPSAAFTAWINALDTYLASAGASTRAKHFRPLSLLYGYQHGLDPKTFVGGSSHSRSGDLSACSEDELRVMDALQHDCGEGR